MSILEKDLAWLGHTSMILKGDNERAIQALIKRPASRVTAKCTTLEQVSKEEQGPFPLGIFPPGSYPAQRQRLYENLPKQLKEAYRREATGQGPMSVDEKNAYVHLGDIQARMEETNTWIEMLMEQMEHMSGGRRFKDLEVWRAQLADQMKEWEDFAKEPVKVIGSVS